MEKIKTRRYDTANYLETREDIANYLEAVLEDGDPELLKEALGTIARAKGMSEIARNAGLGRQNLYKALSPQGNPEFATVASVLRALGLRLSAAPELTPMSASDPLNSPEILQAKDLADKLLSTALAVVAETSITLDPDPTRNPVHDPKVVAILLLSRSIMNFMGAKHLLDQDPIQLIEARILARCIDENLLWIAALRERREDFVKDMLKDEAFNRKMVAELTLKISTKSGADANDEAGLKLRSLIKSWTKKFPAGKKLSASNVAKGTPVELGYIEYTQLSLEAVHCSVFALGRHLSTEVEGDRIFLSVNVHPTPKPEEVLDTLIVLCRALLWVTVTANELVGFTSKSQLLETLQNELDAIPTHDRS